MHLPSQDSVYQPVSMIAKYCANRCSNDVVRTAFTPDEVCKLTIEFYRRNYIEGPVSELQAFCITPIIPWS